MTKIVIVLIIAAVCAVNCQDLDWWEGGNFYQIYPRSYMDSNGDGIGDLQGIKSKLAYVKGLGMDGVWLSPIYKSPQADFGYDISDYRDINIEYGTLDDFNELIAECERLQLKLILDFVPNHTSDEHEWFLKSERNVSGYEDYYIWRDGKIDPYTNLLVPPTNWLSFFRYSAWRWSNIRKQFYLHQFHYKQPDLNYRSAKLVQEMKDVLSYWMHKGVAGFRIDIIVCLFETMYSDGSFPDEPIDNPNCDYNDPCYLNHIYTQDQNETYDMAYQWRELLDNFKIANGGDTRIMMTESYSSVEKAQRFYGDGDRKGSYVPFNFEIIKNLNQNSTAKDYKTVVDSWLDRMPKKTGIEANWVIGNHDQHRAASRLGVTRGDLLNILVQTMPGIAITYQGEELVMTNVHLSWEDTVDPQACNTHDPVNYESSSRDPARTPFPWDSTKNGGFSTADVTWLPAGTNYQTVNVKLQEEATNSHLKIFRRLTTIRKQPVFRQGTYTGILLNNENVFAYKREYGDQVAVVLLNFGTSQQSVNVASAFSGIPAQLKIYTSSLSSGMTNGAEVSSTNVNIGKDIGVVLLSSTVNAEY
ncbi:maltase A1-like [Chironomus tepperi]|uniref:maltase A1-like n=1 Tax=Chironomus tepperi TaxID=113505 RepID=UPI00391FB649